LLAYRIARMVFSLYSLGVMYFVGVAGQQVTHTSDASNYKFLKVWALQDVQSGELR
jgi:hypothetical protein